MKTPLVKVLNPILTFGPRARIALDEEVMEFTGE